jgi:hypothetical protein
MNEPSIPISRAQQVWMHLAGLFGADALKRKFGVSPPPEWESALGDLSDAQLHNGFRRVVKGGSPHVPSLPEFLAACRDSREFAAPLFPEDQQLEDQRFDQWGIAANKHLLAAVMSRALKREGGYTQAQICVLVAAKNAWAQDMRETAEHGEVDVETQKAGWNYRVAHALEAR